MSRDGEEKPAPAGESPPEQSQTLKIEGAARDVAAQQGQGNITQQGDDNVVVNLPQPPPRRGFLIDILFKVGVLTLHLKFRHWGAALALALGAGVIWRASTPSAEVKVVNNFFENWSKHHEPFPSWSVSSSLEPPAGWNIAHAGPLIPGPSLASLNSEVAQAKAALEATSKARLGFETEHAAAVRAIRLYQKPGTQTASPEDVPPQLRATAETLQTLQTEERSANLTVDIARRDLGRATQTAEYSLSRRPLGPLTWARLQNCETASKQVEVDLIYSRGEQLPARLTLERCILNETPRSPFAQAKAGALPPLTGQWIVTEVKPLIAAAKPKQPPQ